MRKSDLSKACIFFFTGLILFFPASPAGGLANSSMEASFAYGASLENLSSQGSEEKTKRELPEPEAKEPIDVPLPTEEEPAPLFPTTAEVVGDSVNIRSGPGTNYNILARVHKGDKVMALGEEFGWVKIEVPSATFSWISKDYVERGEGREGTVTADRVNIRAGSGTNFDILGQVDKGYKIEIVDEVQGWYKIRPPADTVAWIHSDYVYYKGKVLAPPSPPDDTPEIFAKAEKLYEAEMKKPIDQWDFSEIIHLYQEVLKRTKSPSLRYLAASRLRLASLNKRFQDRRRKIGLVDNRLQETLRKIEERHKEEIAQIAARFPKVTYTASGRIEKLTIPTAGATHKLMRGETPIYLLISQKRDLDKFLGQEVRLVGKVEEAILPGLLLIRVEEVELPHLPPY